MLGHALPTSSPKIKYKTFWLFFFLSIVLFVFFSKKEEERKKKKECENKFCSFLRVSWSQPSKFGKLIFNRFLERSLPTSVSRIKGKSFSPIFCVEYCSLVFYWNSPPTKKEQILNSHSRANLVNWHIADFGACSANQCTQKGNIKHFRSFSSVHSALSYFSQNWRSS